MQWDDCRALTVIPWVCLNVFPFTPYQLFTMPSPSTDTIRRLLRVSRSPASADTRAKCLFLPLPARCPSLHPDVTSFPLFLQTPSLLRSLPPSSSLAISAASLSCLVYLHIGAQLNSGRAHDSALESTSCVIEAWALPSSTAPMRGGGFRFGRVRRATLQHSPTCVHTHGQRNERAQMFV